MEQLDFEYIEEPSRSKNTKAIVTAVIVVLIMAVLAVGAALLIRTFVVVTYVVDGPSMYPTLNGGNGAETDGDASNGDVLYLNKLAGIDRGDIIVFNLDFGTSIESENDARHLVKRVIAVAGDRVRIKGNVVYLNGVALEENYIYQPMISSSDMDIVVPEGYVYCMGDNRNNSSDSRSFGPVPLTSVVGKCFLIKGTNGKFRLP